MASWYESAVQASFKPTAEGIVFRCPNPWLFGRWRTFRVNEVQKESLAACLRQRQRLILRLLAIYLLVAFVLTILLQWMGPPTDLSTASFYGIVAGIMVAMLALALVPHLLYMRKIAPLLAGLQRADERMTLHEQLFGVAAVLSNFHLGAGGLGGFLVAASNVKAIAEGLAAGQSIFDLYWSALGLLAGVGLASYFAYLTILKRRLKRKTN
jgi:uncharacterized membrane protein